MHREEFQMHREELIYYVEWILWDIRAYFSLRNFG